MSDISREKLEALTDDIYQVLKDSGNLSGTFLSGAKTFKEAIKCHLKLDTLDAAPWIPVSTPPECCVWEYYEDDDVWMTDCENAWQFVDGTPEENGSKYCMYCGKPISTPPIEE